MTLPTAGFLSVGCLPSVLRVMIKCAYLFTKINNNVLSSVSGEVGLLICKITELTPFIGYAGGKSQTEKKKLRDVFKKGDLYFNSWDLLMIDRENFVYFHDRVGDTFRLVSLNYWAQNKCTHPLAYSWVGIRCHFPTVFQLCPSLVYHLSPIFPEKREWT